MKSEVMRSSTRTHSKARWAFGAIAVVVVLLIAALSVGWYYLAGRLDQEVVRFVGAQEKNGTIIGCPGRSVFGYPFRLGLHCDKLTIDTKNDVHLTAGTLRTAAQVYRPNRIVGELDGPLRINAPGMMPLSIGWEQLMMSGTFQSDAKLDHSAVVADAPKVAVLDGQGQMISVFEARHGEMHVRRRTKDLDLALSNKEARILAPGAPSLPPFDSSLDMTVNGAADWLAGGFRARTLAEALSGRKGTLRSARINVGSASADVSGDYAFDDDGRLTGEFDVALADPQRIATLIGDAFPELSSVANSVASAIGFIGRRENGRSIIPLSVRKGKVSAGFVTLGRLPALK